MELREKIEHTILAVALDAKGGPGRARRIADAILDLPEIKEAQQRIAELEAELERCGG